MGDKWWSRVNCTKDGTLMEAQSWGGGQYRITCLECGDHFISLDPHGEEGDPKEAA